MNFAVGLAVSAAIGNIALAVYALLRWMLK